LASAKRGFKTIGFLLDDQAVKIKADFSIPDAAIEAHIPSVIKRRCR
jgi:hypothetical protein